MNQCLNCKIELLDGRYCNKDCRHQHQHKKLFDNIPDNPIIQAWGEAMLAREIDNMFKKASLADKLKEQTNG
jgi:hypothetical protein